MAMNKFMHPRNPYKNPPDFKQLALDYPEFRKHANQDLSGKVKLNFKDEGAVWNLTKALLHKDFNLQVEILKGRLVPTLPLRMNYLLWIEDLISVYKNSDQIIHGIDIGTGACCIYPLLASKHFSWFMTSTEVDKDNYDCAIDNIQRNNLNEQIKVKKVEEGTYLYGILDENIIYDFCMCNPPFFGDNYEAKRRHEGHSEPRNAPTGTDVELTTAGGEITFVKAIIDDSAKLCNNIRIYTVMLGCKSSINTLKDYIRQKGNVKNLGSTMFCQGRTTRWGLAWTYDETIDLDCQCKSQNKKSTSSSYSHNVPLNSSITFASAVEKILEFLKEHEITFEHELQSEEIRLITLKALRNTWVNSRRRRRELKRKINQQSVEHLANNSQLSKIIKNNSNNKEILPSSNNDNCLNKKFKFDAEKCSNYLLIATLILKYFENELFLDINYLQGSGGRDCAHQLLQCLKNIFK